jgi:hypothetical protein
MLKILDRSGAHAGTYTETEVGVPSRAAQVFDQLRLARVLMMVIVTGTTAFGFGTSTARIALAAGMLARRRAGS